MRGTAVLAGADVRVGALLVAATTGQALQIGQCLRVLVPVPWGRCRALCRETCCWGPAPGRRERPIIFPYEVTESGTESHLPATLPVHVGLLTPCRSLQLSRSQCQGHLVRALYGSPRVVTASQERGFHHTDEETQALRDQEPGQGHSPEKGQSSACFSEEGGDTEPGWQMKAV